MPKKKNTVDGPATKKDILNLDNKIDKIYTILDNKIDTLDNKIGALDNKIGKIDGTVTFKLDKIIKELEIAREDRIFAIAKDREQDQKIVELDKRVNVLENSPA